MGIEGWNVYPDCAKSGREWAADPANAEALGRLAKAIDAEQAERYSTLDAVEIANRDANGAGTLYARVLTGDESMDRSDAAEFWLAQGMADDNGSTDGIMYDALTLASFLAGALEVQQEFAA